MNDPKLYDYWNVFTKLLSKDINQTIEFLDGCTENEAYWLSEVFEDISYKVNSKAFIDCLKRLEEKFPNLDLADDIKTPKIIWMGIARSRGSLELCIFLSKILQYNQQIKYLINLQKLFPT